LFNDLPKQNKKKNYIAAKRRNLELLYCINIDKYTGVLISS